MSKWIEEVIVKQNEAKGIICDRCDKRIPYVNGEDWEQVNWELSDGGKRKFDICKPCFSVMFDFIAEQ